MLVVNCCYCIIILEWSKWTKEIEDIIFGEKNQSKIHIQKLSCCIDSGNYDLKWCKVEYNGFISVCNDAYVILNKPITDLNIHTWLAWIFELNVFAPSSRIHKEKIKYRLRCFIFIVCYANNLYKHITALDINSMTVEYLLLRINLLFSLL